MLNIHDDLVVQDDIEGLIREGPRAGRGETIWTRRIILDIDSEILRRMRRKNWVIWLISTTNVEDSQITSVLDVQADNGLEILEQP